MPWGCLHPQVSVAVIALYFCSVFYRSNYKLHELAEGASNSVFLPERTSLVFSAY